MIRAARRATPEELTTAKRIHTDPDRRETPRAAAAFDAFCRLGPGRTLTKLHQQFLAQREQHRQNPTATPLPPTCYLETIREWSAVFHWAARVAIWDAELQAARQAEMRHQMR
jgi:hypothetical protein